MLFGWTFAIVFVLVAAIGLLLHGLIERNAPGTADPFWHTLLLAGVVALIVGLMVSGAAATVAGLFS